MIDGLVAKRYADALFEVANEKNLLVQVRQDLQFFIKVIRDTEGLIGFLRHPQIDSKVKKEIINKTFKETISPISKNFLFQLIDNRRVEYIEEMFNYYVKLANKAKGIIEVDAITSSTLSEADKEKVIRTLKLKFNQEVRLNNLVDVSLIGGMIIKIGDRIYDGSINKQLKGLKRSLTASRV